MAFPLGISSAESVEEGRFVSYVKVSLRRYAADWKRARQVYYVRQVLVHNQPADEGASEAVDLLAPGSPSAEQQYLMVAEIEEAISNQALYQAFKRLIHRQRYIMTRLMVEGQRQQCVAQELRITQQAVQRSKAQALRRLRAAFELGGEVSLHGRTTAGDR